MVMSQCGKYMDSNTLNDITDTRVFIFVENFWVYFIAVWSKLLIFSCTVSLWQAYQAGLKRVGGCVATYKVVRYRTESKRINGYTE